MKKINAKPIIDTYTELKDEKWMHNRHPDDERIAARVELLQQEFEEKSAKLKAAIDAAEGKATARCLSVDTVVGTLIKVSDRVGSARASAGTKVHYDCGQHFPNAYKYAAYSTHFEAEHNGRTWYITDIYRSYCPSREYEGIVAYSDSAKKAILDRLSKI